MKHAFFVVSVFVLLSAGAFAEDAQTATNLGINKVADIVAEHEFSNMWKGINAWTDQKVIAYIAQAEMREDNIESFYAWFKEIIVSPPDPDTYTVYKIENGEESLEDTILLGKVIHNIYLGMREEDLKKYGKLIGRMRETLYMDSIHIPYAIRGDNARDYYWFSLHNKGVTMVDEEYTRIFGKK
ncbi:MAG: hypothetical protein ISS33_05150 [Candidatus Omnitrophica bacterium]|nr:hypothetical protein [Candidatus Omnitrophota bacterium]